MELVLQIFLVGVLAFIFIGIYFVPTWIARRRHAEHFRWIVLANVVAGCTGAGWIVALIWALYAPQRTTEPSDVALLSTRYGARVVEPHFHGRSTL